MKLGNFGSFDTVLRTKGISGLSGASKADRSIWDEFNQSWEKLSIESELATERLRASKKDDPSDIGNSNRAAELYSLRLEDVLTGPSEVGREVKVRLHQRFFREAVLFIWNQLLCLQQSGASASHGSAYHSMGRKRRPPCQSQERHMSVLTSPQCLWLWAVDYWRVLWSQVVFGPDSLSSQQDTWSELYPVFKNKNLHARQVLASRRLSCLSSCEFVQAINSRSMYRS